MDKNLSNNSNAASQVMNDKIELKQCPYCSSFNIAFYLAGNDRLTGMPGAFSVFLCHNCGLVFQNPRVKQEYISNYYKEKKKHHKPSSIKKRDKFIKARGIPKFKKNAKLLDIGCSDGLFLEEMNLRGWSVVGVEFNKQDAEYAKNKRGLEVYNKRIEDCDFKKEFDVITMRMVLEHLYEPFEALKKITSWLKHDGLLIFSIPYFNGFEFKWFKSYCYGLQLPTHITFFNKAVIKEHLTKLGFRKIKFYYQFFDRDVVASAGYKYQDTNSYFYKLIASNKIIRILLIKPLVLIASLFHKTSRVTIYAEKL